MLPAGALALLGAQLLPPAALAQEDPRIDQLQEQIEALQRQLDDLRGEVENRMPPPPERPPEAPGEPVISGNDQIAAPNSVRQQMMRIEKQKVIGTVKLCVGTDGRVDSAKIARSTGYDDYDDKLLSEMRAWKYQAYQHEGRQNH